MKKYFSRNAVMGISAVLVLAAAIAVFVLYKASTQPARLKDNAFDVKSGITLTEATDIQYENLYRLCKVWGFVKYRHQSVTSGDINWDAELFRIMPRILDAKDIGEANAELSAWLKQFPFEVPESDGYTAENKLMRADTAWINDAEMLGIPLSEYLSGLFEVYVSDTKNGYASFSAEDIRVSMAAENDYPSMTPDDTGMKLLSLFRYWNIIEYFYPYKDIINEDWNAVLREMLPEFIHGDDRTSYVKAVAHLSTFIHDSHASVNDKHGALLKFIGTKMPPVEFMNIDGQIVISAAADEKSTTPTQLKAGDVVLSINGRSIDERVEELKKYISISNDDRFALMMRYSLFGTNSDSMDMVIKRGSKTLSLTVECYSEKQLLSGKTQSGFIENGAIGYINPALLQSGTLDRLMKDFKDTKGIIVDLRNYPSDFIAYKMAEYISPNKSEFAEFGYPDRTSPGDFLLSEAVASGGGEKEKYTKPVVLLMDETSMSQSEFTIMSLRQAPNCTVIGSGSIGADGDVVTFSLPGSVTARMTGLSVFYPDGTQTQRTGLSPDIECVPTIEQLASGKDALMVKAAEIILNPH